MDVAQETDASDPQETARRAPRIHIDSERLPTDSMVTVPLSETDGVPAAEDEAVSPALQHPDMTTQEGKRLSSRPSSAEIMEAFGRRGSREGDSSSAVASPTISLCDEHVPKTPTSAERSRSNSNGSDQSAQVDWAELEKKEEQEPQEEGQDEAMALLLARLEQENNALMADSKATNIKVSRARSQSRPPSMHQLKKLVEDGAADMRASQLPSPPPMTELEFWAALVRDYPQTVQRLPTLTLNKIRSGIPAPLRGVVWQSASGARAKMIEDQYDQLCGESSPYENIINKDLGRSFPGVDMFKDPEGEGQKMLGRVLKCFSLYDDKIGYCQGLGFLVGPLLMQMGDKEAFCVLVRLMEDYDLRACFLPDLSGLHLRIFQFQRLLQHHMPQLAAHLDELGVETAYASSWFLSFFATTCPLPMLFRVYDVLFAEGASETIMRVALALMRRNEKRLLGLTEFEDVMQLLLSRAMWDPYGRNARSADDLVKDLVSFTEDVTREKLQGLEAMYKEEQDAVEKTKVQKSATSFLGRLWGGSNSTKSVALSPGLTAPSRPLSFLRRTPSTQSLASTLKSVDGSESSTNTQSTALTDISRGSEVPSIKIGHESRAMSVKTGHSSNDRDQRDLHYQIEQLLMSVSQLQRSNSELEAALQKQREERKEDHRIVRAVLDKMRSKPSPLTAPSDRASRRRTTITAATLIPTANEVQSNTDLPQELDEAAKTLDERFPTHQTHHRASSMFETKQVLRDNLARAKDQLTSESLRARAVTRELNDVQADLNISREALKETRHRLQDSYNQNQKLEKTIQELRQNVRKASVPFSDATPDSTPSLSRSNTTDSMASTRGGLREFRLGRSDSTKSVKGPMAFAKRASSLATQQVLTTTENQAPADNEALLLELVNAKTAEAVAKQELEEIKNKFENMKKAMNVQTPPTAKATHSAPAATPAPTPGAPAPAPAAATGGGWGWGGWKRTPSTNNATIPK